MPLKTSKTDSDDALTLEWILHIRKYKLHLNRKLCVGCEICSLACPKEAIRLEKQPGPPETTTKRARIDIDLGKCNFCGICNILCPYGALIVTVDGEHLLSVVEKGSFPQLVREIKVDSSKYQAVDMDCEEACPLDLIKVVNLRSSEGAAETSGSLEKGAENVEIQIDRPHCPCCRVCEFKCPEGTIRVQKFFHGKITVHAEKCPEDCRDCLDVCPITGALYMSDQDSKVHANDIFCVYCGACKVVCPVDEALELKRTQIRHTPVSSGAWNKALERVASPLEITKELKAKGSQKARESVGKRLGWRTM